MRINELKSIIRHLKKTFPCPECGHIFREKDIDIVAILKNTIVMEAICPECGARSIVRVSIMQNGKELSYSHQSGEIGPISKDDVLDMHNFLKNFKGDIIDHLK
jgi:predicted RNA-binding Zn-ribbon protein involved in translation (DUF1610 family)